MTSNEDAKPALSIACRHDGPDLAVLARTQLPEMPALHEADGWHTFLRFGPGLHPRDNYSPVVRLGEDGPLLGFAWVDASTRVDNQVDEPWWCINAVAVDPRVAGKGLGTQLVELIVKAAEEAGVVSLYGVSYPSTALFWMKKGFEVGEVGDALVSDRPVRMTDRSLSEFSMSDKDRNQLFVRTFGNAGDGNARLRLHRA